MKPKKLLLWFSIIFILIFSATLGYMLILDLSFIDGLYMTIITISTVGYREVAEMTDAAKIFSIFVIIFSIGMIGYLLSELFKFFSEGSINESWRKNKMKKEISKLTKHIIVCGAGESGMHVIKQFLLKDIDFVVIENDEQAIEQLKELDVNYIDDDATNEDVLAEAGILKARGLITCLSKDADNVFVVLTARELNKSLRIVARAHENKSDKKLKRAGADHTVSPDEIGGKKMASMMISPNIQYFVDNIIDTKNVSIDMEEVVINLDSELIGKKLRETKISEKTGLIVLAIRRENDQFIFNPKADEVLSIDDKMLVVGSKEQISLLRKIAKEFI
ncbi:MAG: potassium channel protein [Acholeplasmataceae bacterium]